MARAVLICYVRCYDLYENTQGCCLNIEVCRIRFFAASYIRSLDVKDFFVYLCSFDVETIDADAVVSK